MTYPTSLGPAITRRLAAMLLGCCMAMACDTNDEPEVEGADLRSEELDARCEFLVRCGFMPDREICMASEAPDPGLTQAVGAASFDRVAYDPEEAAAWLDTLRNLSCEATIANARELAEARKKVFGGRVDPGGTCFADEECAGEVVCDRSACPGDQVCCTGECVALRTLTVGETCPLSQPGTRITATCEDTAYCQSPPDDGSGMPPTEGTCLARIDNGLPCDAVDGCFDGQRCDLGGSGNCYRLAASGDMCNADLQRGSCLAVNEVCAPTRMECVAAPGAGQACVQGQCIAHATCVDDVCVALLRRGEGCDGSLPCLGDLRCRNDVCEAEVTSLVCVDGTPPPPPPPP